MALFIASLCILQQDIWARRLGDCENETTGFANVATAMASKIIDVGVHNMEPGLLINRSAWR